MICLDEKGKELQSTWRGEKACLPSRQAGSRKRAQDYAYKREGSANVLLMNEPLRGWRKVVISQDRNARSFAKVIQQLVDVDFPNVERIALITDTQYSWRVVTLRSLPPAEAHRIAHKLEWHYTPEHGSWLDLAELELSALERQCLGRRFADVATLRSECEAWAKNVIKLRLQSLAIYNSKVCLMF